jgi:arylsulfatase
MSHLDWVPTLLAAAGTPDIGGKLRKGHRVGNQTFKVHLDGYDFLPYLTGAAEKGPRQEFFYFSDDGKLVSMRNGDWKLVFAEQRAHRFDVWRDEFTDLRIPKIFHLRRDPFERADTDSNSYNVWWDHKIAAQATPSVARVQQFLATFREFPPRQRPASFTIDQILEQYLP